MFTYDRTQRSVLAVCVCGARELCADQDEADLWSGRHLTVCQLVADAVQRQRDATASRVRAHRRDTPRVW